MSPERADASPDRFVHVEGVRLRVRVAGEGQPLLLIMGVGGNIEMWHPFDRELHTRVIQTILFHPGFPVDIRHNAKIFREKLAAWAARRLA